jgi:hypothetical protein
MLFLILLFFNAPVVTRSTLTPRISERSFSNLISVNKEGASLNSTKISISLPFLLSPLAKEPKIPTYIGLNPFKWLKILFLISDWSILNVFTNLSKNDHSTMQLSFLSGSQICPDSFSWPLLLAHVYFIERWESPGRK